jgi:hypothetical protein
LNAWIQEFKKPRIQEVKNGPMRDSAPEPVENTQDAYATMTGGPSLLVLLGFLNSRLLDFLFPCVGQEQKLELSLTLKIFPNIYQSEGYPSSTGDRL